MDRGEWDEERENDFLAEAGSTISETIAKVEAAEPLDVETLFTDVWAEMPAMLKDQRDRYVADEPV